MEARVSAMEALVSAMELGVPATTRNWNTILRMLKSGTP